VSSSLTRISFIALHLVTLPAGLRAGEATPASLSDEVLGHRRVAASYLRVGNADLALLEIEALERRLDGEAKDIATNARGTAETGDLAAARAAIARLSDLFAEERRRRGWRILTDCILEASEHLGSVDPARAARLDISRSETRQAAREAARRASDALGTCDAEAPRHVAAAPEFRRLVDGARSSLAQMDDALRTGDPELLHRLLIELRSFDQLLLQRYG